MYPNVHIRIKNEYDRRRKSASDALEARKAELFSKVPRLAQIDAEIRKAGLKINKSILSSMLTTEDAVRELRQTMDGLKKEQAELLHANGFAADDLEPVFTCKKCSDTGIVVSAEGSSESQCSCYKQQLIDFVYGQSNLAQIETEGFKSFCVDFYSDQTDEKRYGIKNSPRKQIQEIREICRHFTDHFSDPQVKNMLFTGPTGVGKTFMAGTIAIELMKQGHTVLYQNAPALFHAIYEYRYKSSQDESYDHSIYRSILETDLLIIDDLGTESPSATRYAELLNIIDTRLANSRKRPCKTIIATNIDLKKLFDYYDERIASRITGGFDLFRFAGDDIRRLKA